MIPSRSKRNLLFGRTSGQHPIRPPWAVTESDFLDLCNRCGECARECPQAIIRMSDGGYPEIDFSAGGCDFCEVCVAVCKAEALKLDGRAPWQQVAVLGDNCFSERGVICRSCGEVCEMQAIRFQQVVGGVTHVLMDSESCTGCGECVAICPAQAITIQTRTQGEHP